MNAGNDESAVLKPNNDYKRSRLSFDLLPAAAFVLFGLVMIYGSITMEPSFSGTNEHRWVPLGMSIFVSVLSAWLLLSQLLTLKSDHDTDSIERRSFLLLVLPCILLLAVYAQMYIWFGYLAATLLCGIFVFRLFQNTVLASILHSAVSTFVLYIIFFKLLKLYNPPGRLVDLSLPF